MVQAKCVQKFRDKHGNIFGYRLQDQSGNIRDVKSDELKQAMKSQQLDVINLTLTSDNRLIDGIVKQNDSNKRADDRIKTYVELIIKKLNTGHTIVYMQDPDGIVDMNCHYFKYYNDQDVKNVIDGFGKNCSPRQLITAFDQAIKYLVYTSKEESVLMHTSAIYNNCIIGEINDKDNMDLKEHFLLLYFKDNKSIDTNKIDSNCYIESKNTGHTAIKHVSTKYEYIDQLKHDQIRITFNLDEYQIKRQEYNRSVNIEQNKKNKVFVENYNKQVDKIQQSYKKIEQEQGKKAVVKEYLKHLNEYFPDYETLLDADGTVFKETFNKSTYHINYEEHDPNAYVPDYQINKYDRFADPKVLMPEPVKVYFQHLVDVIADNIIQGNWLYVYQWTEDDNVMNMSVEELLKPFPKEIVNLQKEVNAPYNIFVGLLKIMMEQYRDKIASINLGGDSYLGEAVRDYVYKSHFKGMMRYLSDYYDWYTDEDGYPLKVVPKHGIVFSVSKGFGEELRDRFNKLPDEIISAGVKSVIGDIREKGAYEKFITKCKLLGYNIE